MKQILITGGAGFIGSHLCARLLEEGNEVICLDNYFTGSKENVIPLLKNPHFELIRHDVSIPFQAEVDEIYNLACPRISSLLSNRSEYRRSKTSVLGAVNMLGLAKRVNAKILQASTSEVYGDPMIHPQPESYWGNVNPIGLALVMTRASVAPRPYLWITIAKTRFALKSSASLIRMGLI